MMRNENNKNQTLARFNILKYFMGSIQFKKPVLGFLIVPILLFFLFFSSTLISRNDYYFSGSGNWEDVSLWSPSYPGTTINYFDYIYIIAGSDCSISKTINNYGIIFCHGKIHNSGEIKNYPGAKIEITEVIDNQGIINNDGLINNGGIINNYRDFANFGNFWNGGSTFNRCGGNYFGIGPTANPIIIVPSDADGDHFDSIICGGLDCDDNDPSIYPSAPEICDGIDNDCDPSTPDGFDENWYGGTCDGPDSDQCIEGYFICSGGAQTCTDNSGDDIEICDGLDNDCDGQVDEGLSFDDDGDGFFAIGSCLTPNNDCDDNDPTIYPGAPDLCDGIDNDCNPSTPDGFHENWYGGTCDGPDSDRCIEGYFICSGGVQTCTDNSDDDLEICDGIDNDCDGEVDEGLSFDNDADGHYAIGSCLTPNDDCDDNDPSIYPGAPEVCDGRDNNCDGQVDEGLYLTFYPDHDRDGFGDQSASPIISCINIPFYVLNNDDCDDNNPGVYPGNTEICDGIDNDCNGLIDDGILLSFYPDSDRDGFGDALAIPIISCLNIPFHVLNNDDCNDGDASINPSATEVCDGLDNNCNGLIDDGLLMLNFFPDKDRDGFGDAFATPISSCVNIPFHVLNDYDCDDNDPNLLGAGTRCDDNNILTINDVWDENCNCSGTFGNFQLLKYCPVDITVQALPGMDYAKVHYPLPGGFSNCPNPAVKLFLVHGYESGQGFPIGTTTVKYLLFDACRNKEYCEFDIKVEPYIPPCQISASLGGFSCYDNNTPRDPSDDTYFYHVTVYNNAGCGVNWSTNKGTWLYNTPHQFGPFFISDGPHSIALWDELNPGIRQTLHISPPPPCGDLDNDGTIDQACANRLISPVGADLCGPNSNLDGLGIIQGLVNCDAKFAFENGTFDEFYDGTAVLKGTLINTKDKNIRFKVDLLFSKSTAKQDSTKDTLVWPPPTVPFVVEYTLKSVYGKLTGDKKAVPGRFRINQNGAVLHIGHIGNQVFMSGKLNFKVERQAWGVQLQDKTEVPIYGELSGDPFVCVPLPNNQTGSRSNLSFLAFKNDIEKVELNWRFSNPETIADYWIESSNDGKTFSTIQFQEITKISSLNRAIDNTPMPGSNYYRLKMLNHNGFTWYSSVEKVDIIELKRVRVYPNPAQDQINVIFEKQPIQPIRIQIASTLGRVLKDYPNIHFQNKYHSLSIQSLPSGTYYLWIFEEGKKAIGKIIVVDNSN